MASLSENGDYLTLPQMKCGGRVVYQIVVSAVYRGDVMSLAHDALCMAGLSGVNKTCNRTLNHIYWPELRNGVSGFCKSCNVCQVVGKPNQKITCAPLQPIPTFKESFIPMLVDCVGPLPKTR